MKIMNLLSKLRQDSGENSIMQTISIAVSAILIAAGLITAPSLINNARDTNAKNDLASVAYSEEFYNSNNGGYVGIAATAGANVVTPATFAAGAGAAGTDGNVKTTFSSGSAVAAKLDASGTYVVIIKSVSTNYFARTGNSTTIINLGKTPTWATAIPGSTTVFAAGDLVSVP